MHFFGEQFDSMQVAILSDLHANKYAVSGVFCGGQLSRLYKGIHHGQFFSIDAEHNTHSFLF